MPSGKPARAPRYIDYGDPPPSPTRQVLQELHEQVVIWTVLSALFAAAIIVTDRL